MENNKNILYMVATIFIILFMGTIFFIMNDGKQEEPIESKPQINDTIYDTTPIDSTIGVINKPWPVKVISVEQNKNEFIEGDWIVATENGVTYYTDEVMRVGQIAFYIGNNGEIITNYGKNKLDPREW
jgi:hypothetical protein